jgi:protein-S-isoprenylcysteine O-methyltransferase Ste14
MPKIMEKAPRDSAGVIAPPLIIFAVILALGLILRWVYPVGFIPFPAMAGKAVGASLLAVSGPPALYSAVLMRRRKTAIDPGKSTTAIVSDGPFGYTRNPLYVSLLLLFLGIAVLLDSLWLLLFLPVLFLALNFGVVVREERYLERKFGEEYLKYKKRVRRWI